MFGNFFQGMIISHFIDRKIGFQDFTTKFKMCLEVQKGPSADSRTSRTKPLQKLKKQIKNKKICSVEFIIIWIVVRESS